MTKLRGGAEAGFIATEDDIRRGVRALRRKCPHMRAIHDLAGDPPLRRLEGGFPGLARIVVGQQLSVASAAAIWGRTFGLLTPFSAEGLLCLDDGALRAAGLSAPKIRTLRNVAHAVVAGGLALDALEGAGQEEIHATLTAVNGIGPWTADIYIMFCLGHADAWAAGDLALQLACQMAMGLDAKPGAKELSAIAERWRPWRGVAARMLWAYYKVVKDKRSGAPA
jgi:DNA-3-methyladenine glycosylase II